MLLLPPWAVQSLCALLHSLGVTPGLPGGFAQKLFLNGEVLTHGIVHHMPEGLSFVAALAEPVQLSSGVHHKAGTDLDDTVVIMGRRAYRVSARGHRQSARSAGDHLRTQ